MRTIEISEATAVQSLRHLSAALEKTEVAMERAAKGTAERRDLAEKHALLAIACNELGAGIGPARPLPEVPDDNEPTAWERGLDKP